MTTFLATTLLAAAPLAQTFVVDVNSGPGSSFPEIANAVTAVPSGSVLIVRSGNYLPFTIVSKAVTVLCDPGVIVPGFNVWNTAAPQAVVVQGLQLQNNGIVQVHGCLGSVHIVDVTTPAGADTMLSAWLSQQVLVERCVLTSVGIHTCPATAVVATTTTAALTVLNANVVFVDSLAQGAPAVPPLNGAGIQLSTGASVRLLGTSVVQAGTPPASGTTTAIGGQGSIQVGPSAAIVGPIALTVVASPTPEAALAVTGGALGASASASLRGTAGALGLLVLGEPGPSLPFGGYPASVWLSPATFVPVAAAVLAFPLTANVPIPPNPQLLGVSFAWQGATWDPVAGFTPSNPGWFTVH